MKKYMYLMGLLLLACFHAYAQQADSRVNISVIANPSGSGRGDYNKLNDGIMPVNRSTPRAGNNRPAPQYLPKQWVQYEWKQPVSTKEIAVYWHNNNGYTHLPLAYRVQYWDGNAFVPVKNASGYGLVNDQLNFTAFDEVRTNKIRLEVDSADRGMASLQEWLVYKSRVNEDYPPVVIAGVDRDVILGGKTYLSGVIKSPVPVREIAWAKESGPGNVTFSNAAAKTATAVFAESGNYVLRLTAGKGVLSASSVLNVKVTPQPQANRLDVVYTRRYKINSKLWNDRAKTMIVNWIPFCIDQINRSDLSTGQGGIDNFIDAGKALRGEPHGAHKGYVFSNAWVHQTVEAMCEALMVDAQGDQEILAAQDKMRKTLDNWIPIILAAQEPDGYLQTAYTLRDTSRWHQRWSAESRGNHEGYVSGYFLESAINHYTLTEGKDKRLYNAAKKLADCWVANIGPGKKAWYDGHQEMEQALVRFGRFVNDMEGHNSHGDSYIRLAKFLLDNRGSSPNGSEYDQSLLPVQQQYEAVGHAVRATYNYSGMADVAAETGDIDYQSAVMSLWDNIVNKKYYITGGIGSGETSEGFGGNYSLRNSAYCESCSSCGLIFFEYKMNLAYHDAKYADLYEETMYNALLGSLSLDGKDFLYTNPLETSEARYKWHSCPCCVGNIPRTLLMMPTWTYVRGDDGLYVNLFVGSTIKVDKIAGTNVEMVQKTDYPWSGKVNMVVNPDQSKEFTVYVRVPNRQTSELYTPVPQVKGLKSIAVNGKAIHPKIMNGYAVIRRNWKKGDRIDMEMPMQVQKITADNKIEADRGRVALRYGPLLYNVETADHQDITRAIGTKPLSLQWKGDFLHGVMTINGTWADGSPLIAIPNYSRLNRLQTTATPNDSPRTGNQPPASLIWIKSDK